MNNPSPDNYTLLLDLVNAHGNDRDLATVQHIVKYADKLGHADGFIHALTLFGFFARLQMELPQRLKDLMDQAQAIHQAGLDKQLQKVEGLL